MFERSSACVLLAALGLAASCSKNDGRSPGIIEGVANDVGNEVDGAGNTVDGMGKDVTNTLDGPPPTHPSEPAPDDAADEAPSGD